MQIEEVEPDGFGWRAAELLIATLRARADAVIGLPTGRTPLPMYAELQRQAVDLSRANLFAIDELHGVPANHLATNASYLRRELPGVHVAVMDSPAVDGDAESARFASEIERAGGLELAIVGIGTNGHLAFNEPGAAFDSKARRVRLERSTREPYVEAFGSFDATPEFGLTLGMAELLAARRIMLLADGEAKASIVARALEGPVTEDVPASALQRHESVLALLDQDAASGLSRH